MSNIQFLLSNKRAKSSNITPETHVCWSRLYWPSAEIREHPYKNNPYKSRLHEKANEDFIIESKNYSTSNVIYVNQFIALQCTIAGKLRI